MKAKYQTFCVHPEGEFKGLLAAPVEFTNPKRPDFSAGLKWVITATHIKINGKYVKLTSEKLTELTSQDEVDYVTVEKITSQFYGGTTCGLTHWLNNLLGRNAKKFVEDGRDYDELDDAEVTYSVEHRQDGNRKVANIIICKIEPEYYEALNR